MSFNSSISSDVDRAVEGVAGRFLENAQYAMEQGDIEDIHDLYDVLSEEAFDDTLAIGLSLDDRLSLAEEYATDYGLELGEVTVETVRTKIEVLAVLVLHQLGLEQTHSHLSALEDAMQDNGLTLNQLRFDNPHGWARHYAEREEGPFQVYEYRNLEGEQIHVDLWEYHGIPDYRFYFEVSIAPEDVSPEENHFDAC